MDIEGSRSSTGASPAPQGAREVAAPAGRAAATGGDSTRATPASFPQASATAKTHRPLVVGAVMFAMFMASVEATIVATAMPAIVADVGGFDRFSWVFSSFLLAQAVTIPIYGKLADLYGRKPVFSAATSLFLVGCLLADMARSMGQLIAARGLQGLGAGGILPTVTTIVGDIYSPQQRARIQGYLSSVWGISSIIGPVLGSAFVTYGHWAWVFWINLPIGLVALAAMVRFLHEQVTPSPRRVDYAGAALLLAVTVAVLVALNGGSDAAGTAGGAGGAGSPRVLLTAGLLAAAAMGAVALARCEQRASDPVLPLASWRHPVVGASTAVSLVTGALLTGATAFLPTFVRAVMGAPVAVAGFCLTSMSVGWPLASTAAGRLLLRVTFRANALLGALLLVAGSAWFVTLGADRSPWWAAAGSFFTGAGMGLVTTTLLVAVQTSVPWEQRGSATAGLMFARIFGGALGAAALGSVLNHGLAAALGRARADLGLQPGLQGVEPASGVPSAVAGRRVIELLMDEAERAQLGPEPLAALRDALATSLHTVYVAVALLALVTVLLAWWLPARASVRSAGAPAASSH